MRHRLFVQSEPTLLSGITKSTQTKYKDWVSETEANVDAAALSLSQALYTRLFGANTNPDASLVLPTALLDQYVETHTDVWVETAEHHAGRYASATPGVLTHPSAVPLDLASDLSRDKKLSGDIGGVIGEGLFAAMLEQQYHRTPDHYIHLKPRYRKRFPDFAVIDPGPILGPLLAGTGTHGPADLVPAEVKTASRVEQPGGMKLQIKKALVQLLSFWQLVREKAPIGPSILFLAVLNPNPPVQSYDLVLIHGR